MRMDIILLIIHVIAMFIIFSPLMLVSLIGIRVPRLVIRKVVQKH